ncbi:class I SAM-dependent methyltransferase [Candidatus Kuenenbacteria bacterium]|nr:class I SAM-dependent methyltransferase [Candidatus Kuenenbacteria bacterium]
MKNTKDSDLFGGTYEYYLKYRPGIPEEVADKILKGFDVGRKDRILDIGCGTGQVAIAIDGKCQNMVCIDSDPDMIELAKKVLKKPVSKISWLNYGSEELSRLKGQGLFKVATICRAFHWMDQDQVLSDLDDLITRDGGIAIFGDGSIWTGKEEWQLAVKKVVQKYLGEERRAGKKKFKLPSEAWTEIISRSRFDHIRQEEVRVKRNWDVESIVGWLFSSSFASPKLFGNRIESFKKDIERELLLLNPKRIFEENAVFSIILASRKEF